MEQTADFLSRKFHLQLRKKRREKPEQSHCKQIATGNHGFTLLEVMIAVTVIAIALAPLLGSQSQSVSLANEAKFYTTAALLAQDKMAQLERNGFQGLTVEEGDFGEDFPGYRWEMEISNVAFEGDNTVSDHLKQIDLTLYWGEGDHYTYKIRYFNFNPESV